MLVPGYLGARWLFRFCACSLRRGLRPRRCRQPSACWRGLASRVWQAFWSWEPRGGAVPTCVPPWPDNPSRMLELIQITNDPAFARRCDALAGFRLWVDLERLGKAERQAGRNTFISAHDLDDVGRIKRVAQRSPLMVRVNPLNEGTPAEVDAVLAGGADQLMLPMFTQASQLRDFAKLVAGRVPIVALLETGTALECLDEWIDTPGLAEVYVGLNDLHLSLGHR